MKKKLLAVILLVSVLLLSSCTVIPASTLEAMFGNDRESVITSGETEKKDNDKVTISKEEYE